MRNQAGFGRYPRFFEIIRSIFVSTRNPEIAAGSWFNAARCEGRLWHFATSRDVQSESELRTIADVGRPPGFRGPRPEPSLSSDLNLRQLHCPCLDSRDPYFALLLNLREIPVTHAKGLGTTVGGSDDETSNDYWVCGRRSARCCGNRRHPEVALALDRWHSRLYRHEYVEKPHG